MELGEAGRQRDGWWRAVESRVGSEKEVREEEREREREGEKKWAATHKSFILQQP